MYRRAFRALTLVIDIKLDQRSKVTLRPEMAVQLEIFLDTIYLKQHFQYMTHSTLIEQRTLIFLCFAIAVK